MGNIEHYPERLTLGMCPETRGPFMCSCGGGDFDAPCAEVEVEYVRADLHRGVVAESEKLRTLLRRKENHD